MGRAAEATASWTSFLLGPKRTQLNKLARTRFQALKPIVFLDEPPHLRKRSAILADATETYERHGHTNSPTPDHFFWRDENLHTASPCLAINGEIGAQRRR